MCGAAVLFTLRRGRWMLRHLSVRRSPCCSSWNGKKPIHSKAVSTPGMPSLCPGMPSLCQSSPGLGLVSRSTGRYTIPETAQEMSIYVMQE